MLVSCPAFALSQWICLQINGGGPFASHVKRWARLLERGGADAPGSSWPELLRRYLLASRGGSPVTEQDMERDDYALMSDDMVGVVECGKCLAACIGAGSGKGGVATASTWSLRTCI